MSDLPVIIRAVREADRAFIKDSWINTMRFSTPALFWVPVSAIERTYRGLIDRLFDARPDLFRVLVNEEDEDQIFAWVCGSRRVTHFVFVKREFRREGLASKLIPDPQMFTHWSKDCEYAEWGWGSGSISYKPSLFRELINGISQTVGRGVAETDKSNGKDSPDIEGGGHREAIDQAVGMVS